ncbi:hypothetical protein GLOIN_2v1774331 [Rhizophagus clarus]|uniref:Uncharacterized protein n=1 Tax=Rhizophagus clarus TaxID=94130 RepID=A0A8H3MBS4_9GLOM|nr:hypothetical protein GLOIN_2v1774331 [Rhizophagus clarus]
MIVQDKWDYDGKVLTKLEVILECINILKSLVKKSESITNSYPNSCCIMILVITQKCNFNYGELPEDVLILSKIKNIVPNVEEVTAGKIVKKRPYHNLDDFLDKINVSSVKKLDKANIQQIKELEQQNQNTPCYWIRK